MICWKKSGHSNKPLLFWTCKLGISFFYQEDGYVLPHRGSNLPRTRLHATASEVELRFLLPFDYLLALALYKLSNDAGLNFKF